MSIAFARWWIFVRKLPSFIQLSTDRPKYKISSKIFHHAAEAEIFYWRIIRMVEWKKSNLIGNGKNNKLINSAAFTDIR